MSSRWKIFVRVVSMFWPCSGCKKVTLWSDGASRAAWRCPNAASYRKGSAGNLEACHCHGRAAAFALELVDHTASTRVTGSKMLALPYEMNNYFPLPSIELGLVPYGLKAYQNERGVILVVGAATHAPQANSTDFPAIAVYRIPGVRAPVVTREPPSQDQ